MIKSALLRSAYSGLTKSERRIADYMAEHTLTVMEVTISELANITRSSEITVSRFCKKLGFSGLQDLKLALMAELSAGENKEYHDIDEQDTCAVVADKIFQNITEGLQDTITLLNYATIDKAAKLIAHARRVAVFGFGNSATVCRDISTRYIRLGLTIQDYSDSHMQVTIAALMGEKDVAIVVSHSGTTKELIESVNALKESGAKVILITSRPQSALAKLCDIVICGMGREVNYTTEAGASRLIHMAIGEVLYTRIAMLNRIAFKDNQSKMRKVIRQKRL